MFDSKMAFRTSLPLSECVTLLKEDVCPWWKPFGNQAVVGRVGSETFSIRMRNGYRNSFRQVLRGRMIDAPGGGTQIDCSVGMSRWVMIFMCMWFGGLILIGGTLVTTTADGLRTLPVLLGMFAFGVALVALGRFLARNEKDDLVQFVCFTLVAREMPFP
jgi:hypothetical protein